MRICIGKTFFAVKLRAKKECNAFFVSVCWSKKPVLFPKPNTTFRRIDGELAIIAVICFCYQVLPLKNNIRICRVRNCSVNEVQANPATLRKRYGSKFYIFYLWLLHQSLADKVHCPLRSCSSSVRAPHIICFLAVLLITGFGYADKCYTSLKQIDFCYPILNCKMTT